MALDQKRKEKDADRCVLGDDPGSGPLQARNGPLFPQTDSISVSMTPNHSHTTTTTCPISPGHCETQALPISRCVYRPTSVAAFSPCRLRDEMSSRRCWLLWVTERRNSLVPPPLLSMSCALLYQSPRRGPYSAMHWDAPETCPCGLTPRHSSPVL
jgi:hypothetical protein